MTRRIPLKIVAASGAIVLASGVAAAAVTTPDEADAGLDKASEQTGLELPASEAAHPTQLDHPGNAPEVEEVEVGEVEAEQHGVGPQDNHGAVVSAFADTTELEGSERGQAIAAVARSDAGMPEAHGGANGQGAGAAEAGAANAEAHRP